MKASIRQISEMTGFSPATVSNALNNKRGVNHETAAKILEAAHACGYLSKAEISTAFVSSFIKTADRSFPIRLFSPP